MKCEANDSCTGEAKWIAEGRAVKQHACCDGCKSRWAAMSFQVTFTPLKNATMLVGAIEVMGEWEAEIKDALADNFQSFGCFEAVMEAVKKVVRNTYDKSLQD